MRITGFLAAGISGALLAVSSAAFAHSEGGARHGGAVAEANDLGFELAATPEGATLYIDDHGKPFATAGMTGKLTVLNGKERSEAPLEPAGENRLQARGVKIGKGTKSVANVTLPNKKAITVRFSHR